ATPSIVTVQGVSLSTTTRATIMEGGIVTLPASVMKFNSWGVRLTIFIFLCPFPPLALRNRAQRRSTPRQGNLVNGPVSFWYIFIPPFCSVVFVWFNLIIYTKPAAVNG